MSTPDNDTPHQEFEDGPESGYEVGYGKPPKHSQFQNGNKKGKGQKKGAKAIKTVVKEALGLKVEAKLGGKVKKFTKFELSLHQLATKASGGDLKAIEKVIALQQLYGPAEDPDGPSPEKLKLDRDTLRDHLEMLDFLYPPELDDEEGEEDGDE